MTSQEAGQSVMTAGGAVLGTDSRPVDATDAPGRGVEGDPEKLAKYAR